MTTNTAMNIILSMEATTTLVRKLKEEKVAALARASAAEAKLALTRAEVTVLQDGIKATLEMKDLKDLSSERLVLLLLEKKKNCGSSTFVAALRDSTQWQRS